MTMYPGDEPYTENQARFDRLEREAEWMESDRARHLYRAEPILRRTLLPDTLVVWETLDGETFLACVSLDDKPRVEVRYEDGMYVAQAYQHDAPLKDFEETEPIRLALRLKVYLADVDLGEFRSAAAADFYNRR